MGGPDLCPEQIRENAIEIKNNSQISNEVSMAEMQHWKSGEIQERLHKVVGLECWRLTSSPSLGGSVGLHFGKKIN
jgi:hypothetical protein